MKPATIGYGKEYPDSSSGYSEYLYLEVSFNEGEDVDLILSGLREKVNSKLGLEDKSFDLERLISAKQSELRILEENLGKATERWKKAVEFFQRYGLDLENPDYDPIPF